MQFIGDPELPPGGLLECELDHRLLDFRRHPVFQHRFAPRDLLQCGIAAFVIQFSEPIKAVAAVAHNPARLRDVAELLGQFQQTHLDPNYLPFCGHRPRSPFPEPPRTLTGIVRLSRRFYTSCVRRRRNCGSICAKRSLPSWIPIKVKTYGKVSSRECSSISTLPA